jgi:hypothetical protein
MPLNAAFSPVNHVIFAENVNDLSRKPLNIIISLAAQSLSDAAIRRAAVSITACCLLPLAERDTLLAAAGNPPFADLAWVPEPCTASLVLLLGGSLKLTLPLPAMTPATLAARLKAGLSWRDAASP